ncbi:hypothetical protein RND71_000103 [Anisodus tanguticus]|uniref:Uncharacterized protein n=1 Tax=Anisodus tanguticus TaxID=243964 RepID=A0AAE1SYU7_9SOLA|nr:hypothetical protein RND71_000103 [Anisodus tanguticus]
MGKVGVTDKSSSRRASQLNSLTTLLIHRYSASAEESEIDVCFLDFQEMGDEVTTYRSSGIRTTSPIRSSKDGLVEKNRSCQGEVTTRNAAIQ